MSYLLGALFYKAASKIVVYIGLVIFTCFIRRVFEARSCYHWQLVLQLNHLWNQVEEFRASLVIICAPFTNLINKKPSRTKKDQVTNFYRECSQTLSKHGLLRLSNLEIPAPLLLLLCRYMIATVFYTRKDEFLTCC